MQMADLWAPFQIKLFVCFVYLHLSMALFALAALLCGNISLTFAAVWCLESTQTQRQLLEWLS